MSFYEFLYANDKFDHNDLYTDAKDSDLLTVNRDDNLSSDNNSNADENIDTVTGTEVPEVVKDSDNAEPNSHLEESSDQESPRGRFELHSKFSDYIEFQDAKNNFQNENFFFDLILL